MFQKSFLISYVMMRDLINTETPIHLDELQKQLDKEFGCSMMFLDKIRSILGRAGMIKTYHSKGVVKLRDVSLMELYLVFHEPLPENKATKELFLHIESILSSMGTVKFDPKSQKSA